MPSAIHIPDPNKKQQHPTSFPLPPKPSQVPSPPAGSPRHLRPCEPSKAQINLWFAPRFQVHRIVGLIFLLQFFAAIFWPLGRRNQSRVDPVTTLSTIILGNQWFQWSKGYIKHVDGRTSTPGSDSSWLPSEAQEHTKRSAPGAYPRAPVVPPQKVFGPSKPTPNTFLEGT